MLVFLIAYSLLMFFAFFNIFLFFRRSIAVAAIIFVANVRDFCPSPTPL